MRKPCKDCPFRKTALRGYVGPYESADELIIAAKGGHGDIYKCHTEVNEWADHVDDNGPIGDELAWELASPCAGALIMLKKSFYLPREKEHAGLVKAAGTDDKIMTEWETKKHHDMSIMIQEFEASRNER